MKTWTDKASKTEQTSAYVPKTAQDTTKSETETTTRPFAKVETTTKKTETTKPKAQPEDYDFVVTAPAIDTKLNTKYTRTGVIAFSDKPTNKYIILVSEKYEVPAYLLAAIYTLPYEGMEDEADGNMVLEFDGSRDLSGKLIRTEDTLKTIYMIDAKDKCKRISVDGSQKDDYNRIEKKVTIMLVKEHVMPKFQYVLYE